MADRTYLKIGDILDNRWEVVNFIGRGGMSNVYLVRDLRMHQYWAMKEVPVRNTPEGLLAYNSVIEETNLLKSLNYRSIPKVIEILTTRKSVLIVMEFVDGQSLREVIFRQYSKENRGKISEKLILKWGISIAKTLRYLHNHKPKIIYRDMKPHNVVLTSQGDIVLLDFGISKAVTDGFDYSKEPSSGTAGYLAPEQISKQPYFDERSDIFALGRTLYFMATGHSPSSATPLLRDLIVQYNLKNKDEATLEGTVRNKRVSESAKRSIKIKTGIDLDQRPDIVEAVIHYLQITSPTREDIEAYERVVGYKPNKKLNFFRKIRQWDSSRSVGLETIIEKATQQNPEDRYQTVDEMIYDLEHIDELSSDHKKQVNRRFNWFVGSVVTLLLGISLSVGGYFYETTSSNQEYETLLESGVATRNVADLLEANEIKPEQVKPYSELTKLYMEDSKFSNEEELELLGILQPNLTTVKKEKGAGDLFYSVALLYWFYLEDGGQLKSTSWFELAKEVGVSKGNSHLLDVYLELGKFKRGILSSITSNSDKGMYKTYLNALRDLRSEANGDGRLELLYVQSTFDLLDSYTNGLKTDGYAHEDLVQVFDEAIEQQTSMLKRGDLTAEQKEKLEALSNRVETIKKKIDTSYGIR